MNPRRINLSVVNLMRFLSDDGFVKVTHRKHIKVVGNFAGRKKVITLLTTTSHYGYESQIRSQLRRLIEPLNVDKKTQHKINKFIRISEL